MLKNLKKIITGVALSGIVALTAFASACTIETAHPSVKISVNFNSTEYVLEYQLYRNMYPQTVRHFIELADNGFYNGTVIHNYTSNDWFTGGYSYDETSYSAASGNAGNMGDYLDNQNKEEAYYALKPNLTTTVYSNIDMDGENWVINPQYALPSVYGEFSANGHQITKGALSAEYGTLKMFYYAKSTTQKVYVNTVNNELLLRDYKYNSATSLFSMQVGSSSTYSATNYCVFATIKDTTPLDSLLEAVSDYVSENYTSSSNFTTSVTTNVDNLEEFSTTVADKSSEVTFTMTDIPIIISTVTVVGY